MVVSTAKMMPSIPLTLTSFSSEVSLSMNSF